MLMDSSLRHQSVQERLSRLCQRHEKGYHPLFDGQLLRMGNDELVQPLGRSTLYNSAGDLGTVVIYVPFPNCVAGIIIGCNFLK